MELAALVVTVVAYELLVSGTAWIVLRFVRPRWPVVALGCLVGLAGAAVAVPVSLRSELAWSNLALVPYWPAVLAMFCGPWILAAGLALRVTPAASLSRGVAIAAAVLLYGGWLYLVVVVPAYDELTDGCLPPQVLRSDREESGAVVPGSGSCVYIGP